MYRKMHVHFVGIGGIGMSGIAELLCNLGHSVSGSDMKKTPVTDRLETLGICVFEGHRGDQVRGADVIVISSAIRKDNEEVLAARENKIPVIPRAQMLAELMRMKYGVAVAGTHGKTTTTSMIATVLAHAGRDPTAVIGGRLKSIGSNAKLGAGDFLVAEADESDGTFLLLSPTIAVVTSIDPEHLDYYGEFSKAIDAYAEFLRRVPFYGLAVLCVDAEKVAGLLPVVSKRVVTYGLRETAAITAKDIRFDKFQSRFLAFREKDALGQVVLRVPGRHNVSNALAAIAVGLELGIPFPLIGDGLREFSGVERRFEVKGEPKGILVIDDYGHHPEEIKATLKAAREGWIGEPRRLVAVFQPHRFSRTRDLFQDFLHAFDLADVLFVMDVYPAGEDAIPGIHAEALYSRMKAMGHVNVTYLPRKDEAVGEILKVVRSGDMVITLGAGDVWKVGESLVKSVETETRDASEKREEGPRSGGARGESA